MSRFYIKLLYVELPVYGHSSKSFFFDRLRLLRFSVVQKNSELRASRRS